MSTCVNPSCLTIVSNDEYFKCNVSPSSCEAPVRAPQEDSNTAIIPMRRKRDISRLIFYLLIFIVEDNGIRTYTTVVFFQFCAAFRIFNHIAIRLIIRFAAIFILIVSLVVSVPSKSNAYTFLIP